MAGNRLGKSLGWIWPAAVLSLAALVSSARADIVYYRLGGSNLVVVLQGKVTVNSGGTVTFQHPKLGTMYFNIKDTEIKKVPTVQEQFGKQLGRAGNSADKRFQAAQWALRHGLLKQFYEAVDETLKANPQHAGALKVKKLQKLMEQPIGDSSQQEKELRDLVNRPEMKIAQSAHFILLHDTPDKPAANRRIPRAQERLKLLEQVYESFLLKFYANGVELEIPKERMKVVLFQERLAHGGIHGEVRAGPVHRGLEGDPLVQHHRVPLVLGELAEQAAMRGEEVELAGQDAGVLLVHLALVERHHPGAAVGKLLHDLAEDRALQPDQAEVEPAVG